MHKYKVIGIAGPVRSGKTTACSYLNEKHNCVIYRNSVILEKIASDLHMGMNRTSLANLGTALFTAFGRELLARYWMQQIIDELNNKKFFIIDGIRFPEEVSFYRDNCDFTLLSIFAPDDQRHSRSKTAIDKYKDGDLDVAKFLNQSELESESFIDQLINSSDRVIVNDTSKDNFYNKLDEFITLL